MLKIEDITKTYKTGTFGGKDLKAVKNVSFDIHDGEIVSLIGESGSGKSTIGKMILRLISTTSGKIYFNDKDVSLLKDSELKEYYRHVQGVFQDPFSTYNPIFKADRIFSVLHEEFFPHIPASEWKGRVDTALKSVGMNPAHVLNKFPHQLSGGQLQRFLIARALLLDTKFLVADEIISMLDASTRIDVLNLLSDLRSKGLSVLFITHDLSLGYYISERAVILYKGSVVEIGETKKIFDNPVHPYTRMLMSCVPRLDKKWQDVEVELTEKKPMTANGCVFYERCHSEYKLDECAHQSPALVEVEPNHSVACVCCKG
ncbi:ABC transporter ATP-binding protein [Leptolinea tardivitalis]|uniref:Peptide ABC transporter ATPase n=1 Tax=Leptolinea tardivitalis TaxID=229920 RepID=A0A0P6WL97_9CHLR|nr:ABC transporter ATP-binding protein [Leptolinea tardivitalis]KPL70564.1 peptide ABC transporter ATPase [Leptolinea tardivitalis]GAP22172.1 oligopeptide/dipeptide ABC transporter, ATP-binding protein, C-terminal domain [Leptolinea tardivitalis]